MRSKIRFAVPAILSAVVLTGCTCVNTHVPGRYIDHGAQPTGVDVFFCILDYILFPPQPQGYVVAPEPVVVAAPAPVVMTAPPPVHVHRHGHRHAPPPPQCRRAWCRA